MKNRVFSTLFLLSALVSPCIAAQEKHPEHDAVMVVVDRFFEALNTDNQVLMASISINGSHNYSIREKSDSTFELRSRQQYNAELAPNAAEYTERYWDEIVLVNDLMAVFWAPYDFYIDGVFSHCGVDVFDLVKMDGQWKLANSMYTVIRTGCPISPLGEFQR
jgi:hypothetical protein|tara:strand:+ start:535 stop:1023 length:489 start_codon:yes stop_codon:yes gene_type:complete